MDGLFLKKNNHNEKGPQWTKEDLVNLGFDIELGNKYAPEIISYVWERLAEAGIKNADDMIGTRETIENRDMGKFWSHVQVEDLECSIAHYKKYIEKVLEIFAKHGEGFVPEIGAWSSSDTTFWDNKIAELEKIKTWIQANQKKHE